MIALVLLACTDPRPPGWLGAAPAEVADVVAPPIAAPYELDGPVAIARAMRVPAAVPARFEVRLPRSVDEWPSWYTDDQRPPESWIRSSICADRAGWRAEWAAAVDEAAAAGASAVDLTAWAPLARSCGGEDRCAWVRDHVGTVAPAPGTPEDAVRTVYLDLLSECRSEADAALVEHESVPTAATLAWVGSQWQWAGWSPRTAAELRAAVAADNVTASDTLAQTVARMAPDRAVDTLLDEIDRANDRDVRDVVTAALAHSADPRAQERVAELCSRRASEVDLASGSPRFPECGWRSRAGWQPSPDPSTDVDAWVREPFVEPAAWVAANPEDRQSIVDALIRCSRSQAFLAANSDDPSAAAYAFTCLRALAELDRPAAVAVAQGALGIPDGAPAHTLAALLTRFPTEDALVRHLREVGLAPGAARPSPRAQIDAVDVLAHQGRVYRLYTDDPGDWPPDHAVLLYNLAALGGAALDDVRFDVTHPAAAPDVDPTYPMFAWDGAVEWRFHANDCGTGYDVPAATAFLNAILSERGSDLRYARLTSGDVVLANAGALQLPGTAALLPLVDGAVPCEKMYD